MKYAAVVLLLCVVGMTTAKPKARKYNILPKLLHDHVAKDFTGIKFPDRQIGKYDITGLHGIKITATKATLTRYGNRGMMELDGVTVLVAGKAQNRITKKVGKFFYRVVLKDVKQVLQYPKRTTLGCKVTFTSNIEAIWVGGKKKMSMKPGFGKVQTGKVCYILKKLEHIVWKHMKSTKG